MALVIMLVLAGYTAYKHAVVLEKIFRNSVISIAFSAFLLISPLFVLGIFPLETRFVIPIGSIIIGNSMNTCSLAIDRYLAEIKNRRDEIEAYLILGASPAVAVGNCLRQSLRSSLIPIIDNMKNLGVIWIPGIMTGMLITGEDPYLAASTQIVLFVTILLAGLTAAAILLHLSTNSIFNKACQLKEF
jgi:putative ABC transport system permease protein